MSLNIKTTRLLAIVFAATALLCMGQGCPSSLPTPSISDNSDKSPPLETTIEGPRFLLIGDTASYSDNHTSGLSSIWYGWSLDGAAAELEDVNSWAHVTGVSLGKAVLSIHLADPRYEPALDVWGNKTIQVIKATINGPTTLARGSQGSYTLSIEGANVADFIFEWYGDYQNTVVASQSGMQATFNVTDTQFNDIFGDTASVAVTLKDAYDQSVIGGVSIIIDVTERVSVPQGGRNAPVRR